MAPLGRPRVLVIDDDPNVRVLISDLLTYLGYEPDQADGGVQGLALLGQRSYDLIITDLRMPHLTGWDVVNTVRGRRPTMPIIMISGFATEDDVRHAIRVRVLLLHQPFSVAELRRAVRSAVLTAEVPTPKRRTEGDLPRGPLIKIPEEQPQEPGALEREG